VKHRSARSWEDWLGDVIDRESRDADRRRWWFWRVHDTLAILDTWSRYVPAERVHVIITPPRGSANGLLWERFASVLDLNPARADLSLARANTSLDVAEIEFLRRLNHELPPDMPDWFYMWRVKEGIAHRAAPRPGGGRLVLPADRDAWAKEQAEALIAGLGATGYDLTGDLDELRPRPVTEPGVDPADQPAEQVLDAAVQAVAAMVTSQYRRAYPAAGSAAGPGGARGLARRLETALASRPRVKRAVRELSSRSPAVRRLRVLAWRELERTRARGRD